MPKRTASNAAALRSEFAAQLSKATVGIPRARVAEVLGVTRQMLGFYLKARCTPGGEVIKRACDAWGLSLSVKGFEFSGEAFAAPKKKRQEKVAQLNLLELLQELRNDQLEAKIVGREGDSFYLTIRIRAVA